MKGAIPPYFLKKDQAALVTSYVPLAKMLGQKVGGFEQIYKPSVGP